ncbi:MAG: tRNA (adenosine(37)-N6)-dimethylallyltransferase MiaA [Kiritimatiellae bacterium]|nr:tRNA (adenosine(37)-N6)-dimethylallyltransferase MiaA [Kiritimatiellia bacterium]
MAHAWIVAGATASGKSAVAQILAERLDCDIISADAMSVYKGMDIGTAKPPPSERGSVKYLGLDLTTPDQSCSAGMWLADVSRATASLDAAPSCRLIVAGGTGLYIKAITQGLEGIAANPDARARWHAAFESGGITALRQAISARAPEILNKLADPDNPRRLIRALEHIDSTGGLPANWSHPREVPLIAVLRLPRAQLHARIHRRVAEMFRQGFVEEVRGLCHAFPQWSPTAAHAIGYAEVRALIEGNLSLEAAIEKTVTRTRQLAKRQETWFRHQAQAVWIDIMDSDPPACVAERVLKTWREHGPAKLISV